MFFIPTLTIQSSIDYRRNKLSLKLYEEFDGKVRYGFLQGLFLKKNAWWGHIDLASMLLGIYEKEVLDFLAEIPNTHRIFVDLGAAAGYYGVGLLVNGKFDKSYCFEISPQGQESIRLNALNNQVSEKLYIFGIADRNLPIILKQQCVDLSHCVLLCDIEGAEFDLFTPEMFEAFSGSIIIIEIHDWFFQDGAKKLQQLKQNASLFFHIDELTTGSRDLSQFPELNALSDTDRWLLCSESRPRLMSWLKLLPR